MKTKPKMSVQVELAKVDASWVRAFRELVRSKAWARLSADAKIVYVTAQAFASGQTGAALPSLHTLEEHSGLSHAAIARALRELESLGHVLATKAQGEQAVPTGREEASSVWQDGRAAVAATFDHLPDPVTEAAAELRNFITQGMTDPGKLQYIHIDKLVLNVAGRDLSQVQGEHTTHPGTADADRLAGKRWAREEQPETEYQAELRNLEAEEEAGAKG